MHLYTRMNLESTIQYHADLADFYKKQVEAEKPDQSSDQPSDQPTDQSSDQSSDVTEPDAQPQPSQEEQPPSNGEQKPQSAAAALHEMHAEVSKQLREVLAANPMMPTIEEQRAARPVTRSVVRKRAVLH